MFAAGVGALMVWQVTLGGWPFYAVDVVHERYSLRRGEEPAAVAPTYVQ